MKKKMTGLMLAFALAMTVLTGCQSTGGTAKDGDASDKEEPVSRTSDGTKDIGALSFLNISEDELSDIYRARVVIGRQLEEEGYATSIFPMEGDLPEPKAVFFDTLDAAVLSLEAGDIDALNINQSVARYLSAKNDNLVVANTYDLERDRTTFADIALGGIYNNDFSFMLMEGNEQLRDDINRALVEMRNDGILKELVDEQIEGVIAGGEMVPVALPVTDSDEVLKIAVTGALPPMDYVGADGSPAGFNTAVLAELGRRLDKNIEIVVVDSVGRAAALSSGAVDVVFWTRTNSYYNEAAKNTEEENAAIKDELLADMTEEEASAFLEFDKKVNLTHYGDIDRPERTIITDPYYSDVGVNVLTKEAAQSITK